MLFFLDTKSYFRNYYKDYLHKYGNIWHFMAIIKKLPYIYLIINQMFTTEYNNMAILFQNFFMRGKNNGSSHYTDNHTTCNATPRLSLLFGTKEHQIAP